GSRLPRDGRPPAAASCRSGRSGVRRSPAKPTDHRRSTCREHRDTATGTRPGLDRLDPRGGGSVPSVTEPLTVMFMPESAYGPTNQCIGLGKVLLDRGHRVVFAAEASWAGKLEPLGFVEDLVDLAAPDPDAGAEAAG